MGGFFYSYDEIAVGLEIGLCLDFAYFEDQLILVGFSKEEANGFSDRVTRVITLDLDGNIIADAKLDEMNVFLANVDSLGRIWALGTKKTWVYGAETEYVIMCFTNSGDMIKTIELKGENDFIYNSNRDSFIVGISPDEKVYFYTLRTKVFHLENGLGELLVLDEEGKTVELIDKRTDHIMDLFRLNDGRVFIRTLDKGDLEDPQAEMSLSCLCIECLDKCHQEERANAAELSNTLGYAFLGGSDGYDIILASRINVYGGDLKGERTELLNWMAENVDNSSRHKHTLAAGDIFYTLGFTPSAAGLPGVDGKTNIIRLTKALNNDAKRKKIINVAALYIDERMKGAVVDFNKSNPDYRIEVKAYSDSFYAWADDDTINAFNIDLASGYRPDMVFLAHNSPNLSYAAKGLFADINELMDNDPDFDKDDYLSNIFKLLEINGKLNFGTTSFSVNTLMGRVSEWGERLSFTWEEYDAFLEGYPANILPIGIAPLFGLGGSMTKEEFLTTMLTQKMSDFVDFETGTCSFENADFMQLLKKTDRFPLNRGDYTAPMDYQSGNPPLLWLPYFDAFSNMSGFLPQSIKTSSFNEEIVYLGIPTNEAVVNGSVCNPNDLFAIFEGAKEKEGAWEFAKYLLTDFQETAGMGLISSLSRFPVKISALKFLAEETKKPEPYNMLNVPPPNDREIERVFELVHSLMFVNLTDDFIMNIISEEANAYFTGQKTPEQVAAVIQNRVSLYLEELR